MAIILVTHDLGVASEIADRIAVMYAGRLSSTTTIGELIRAPRHPYTAGLLASTVSERTQEPVLTPIPGAPPNLADIPGGCAFAPRCMHTFDHYTVEAPQLIGIESNRAVRWQRVIRSRRKPADSDAQQPRRLPPALSCTMITHIGDDHRQCPHLQRNDQDDRRRPGADRAAFRLMPVWRCVITRSVVRPAASRPGSGR